MSQAAAVESNGERIGKPGDPCVMVIFGASGDLTRRKLIPALYNLGKHQLLSREFAVVGVARDAMSTEDFRKKVLQDLQQFTDAPVDADLREWLERRMYYLTGEFGDQRTFAQLKELLQKLDTDHATHGNYFYYLAIAPDFFGPVVEQLNAVGLMTEENHQWRRVIVEKPFGRDLDSARALNQQLLKVVKEQQVYRIDHYLGKETVQNLLVFRFANGVFEPIWNRRYIDHVQITVAEDLGVERRGSYYEEAGLLRDMIQNHMMQLMSLVAMEPPTTFQASAVRDEKAKVLRSIRPIPLDRINEFAVRGQYKEGIARGQTVPAYRAEPKVSPNSTTETFAALKFYIDDWRWADVPFYLRSGKRMAKRASEISIQFRRVPHLLFRGTPCDRIEPNLLTVHIQPDEGMSLRFSAKLPGPVMQIRPVTMNFRYGEVFGASPPTAYETLLLDCMLGDATLFNREDAVELSWELVDPILERWRQDGEKGLALYDSGGWGPSEADAFIAADGRAWEQPDVSH